MTDKTSFDNAQAIVVKLSVGQVKPVPYCYAQKADGRLHSPGLVRKPQEPLELPEDLARFIAYAG